MPTSSAYLDLAVAFDAAAADADRALSPVATLLPPSVLDGGLLTEQATGAIGQCHDRLAAVAQHLRDEASECRRRAAVVELYRQSVAVWERADDRYARALRDWHALDEAHRASPSLPPAGPRPVGPGDRPAKPFAWIS